MGPLKQSLVENISLQRCNCDIFGLTDTMALFAKEARFYRFWVFFRASSLQNEVGDPPFFLHNFLASLTHHLSMVKFPEKNQCLKNLARTSLSALKHWCVLCASWSYLLNSLTVNKIKAGIQNLPLNWEKKPL